MAWMGIQRSETEIRLGPHSRTHEPMEEYEAEAEKRRHRLPPVLRSQQQASSGNTTLALVVVALGLLLWGLLELIF